MIKGIIFDVDNTLIDFYRMKNISISESIDAMADAGLKVNKTKAFKIIHELFNNSGIEAHHIFQKFSQKILGKIDYDLVAAAIVSHKRVWNGFLHTYPGVMETLIKLKQMNIKLGIVSDARKLHCYERIYGMRINNFFDVIVTYDDTRKFKPAKRPFLHALKKLKLKPENCIMVGDWIKGDIGGAKKIGMHTCFAKYGAPTKESKRIINPAHLKKYKIKPDYILNEFRDIYEIIIKIN